MAPIKGQYLVDSKGRAKAVLINLRDYRRLMKLVQDLRDVKFIHRHRHEGLIPMEVVHRALK